MNERKHKIVQKAVLHPNDLFQTATNVPNVFSPHCKSIAVTRMNHIGATFYHDQSMKF